MISRVWKNAYRLLESMMSICLRFLAWALFWTCLVEEWNDVLQILTNICTTAGVEIKSEPLNSCSLRAARIQRSDFMIYMNISLYVCIYASMHLCLWIDESMHRCILHACIYASMCVCIFASMSLCIYLSIHLYLWNESRPREAQPKILVYI